MMLAVANHVIKYPGRKLNVLLISLHCMLVSPRLSLRASIILMRLGEKRMENTFLINEDHPLLHQPAFHASTASSPSRPL